MLSTRGIGFKVVEIIATLILNASYCSGAEDDILPCDASRLDPCPGEHQICNQTTLACYCMKGYVMVDKTCEIPNHDYHSHNATAAVVVIFTLALVICGLVLVIRKYNLIEYLRQKINWKRNSDVMYEDVMIGQDDPPLTP